MKKTSILILLLVLGANAQYATSSERTQSVIQLCSLFTDRSELVDEDAEADNKAYKDAISTTLKTDGNQLILGLIDGSKGMNDLQALSSQIAQFIGPFAVGLVVIMFIWMFLCCCCCCPHCCPSKCCQKPENETYTRCQLVWPTIVLVLALLLVVIVSIIGITRAPEVEKTYSAMSCSVAICLDDFINGNVSSTGNFFLGLTPLQEGLTSLKDGYLADIQTQLDTIDSSAGTETQLATSQGDQLLNDISALPTGNPGETMNQFSYNNFNGSAGSFASTFPDSLGGVDGASGQVFQTYTEIQVINLKIQGIMESAQLFGDSVAAFTSGVDGAIDAVATLEESLIDADSSAYNILTIPSEAMKISTSVITVVFAIFIAISAFGILGALLMTFCEKYSCRYLVYFSCILLFILGVACFLLAVVFSILTPFLYYSCEFLQYSVESGDNFQQNFSQLLGTDTVAQIKVCMPGEDGDIVSSVMPDIEDSLDSMSDAIQGMNDFDVTQTQYDLSTTWTKLDDLVVESYRTTILDFSSSGNKNILKKMANPAEYSGCNANDFGSDSWVPSIQSGAVIDCQSNTGVDSDETECPDTATLVSGYNSGSGSCYGCLDTFKVLGQSPTTIAADLKARYPDGGACDSFADDMAILWDNFYSIKEAQYSPIVARLDAARNIYDDPGSGYYVLVGNVGDAFDRVMNSFSGGITSITDPEYGMVAGLNCLLFGEDFQLVIDTTCVRVFNLFYMLRYTLGAAAFGILFALCCSTCSGVRHYKHSAKKGQIIPEHSSRKKNTYGEDSFTKLRR